MSDKIEWGRANPHITDGRVQLGDIGDDHRPDGRDALPSAIRVLGYALADALHIDRLAGWLAERCPKSDGTCEQCGGRGYWWCDIDDDEYIRQTCGCVERESVSYPKSDDRCPTCDGDSATDWSVGPPECPDCVDGRYPKDTTGGDQ